MTFDKWEQLIQPNRERFFLFQQDGVYPVVLGVTRFKRSGKYFVALFCVQAVFLWDKAWSQGWSRTWQIKSQRDRLKWSIWWGCSASQLPPIHCSEQQGKLPALSPVLDAVPLIPQLSQSCLHPSDIFRLFFFFHMQNYTLSSHSLV